MEWGVGGFIGSQILNSDFDVTFIARGERYKSLKIWIKP